MTIPLLLEVAISMVFLYLLGSQVVLSIYELWAGYTNSRGKFLYRKLKGTFGAETIAKLYAEKPIAALTPADQKPPEIQQGNTGKNSEDAYVDLTIDNTSRWAWWLGNDGLPAYVPANLFASTLLAMVSSTASTRTAFTSVLTNETQAAAAGFGPKAAALLTGILAGLKEDATLAECQKSVAAWYDDYGERLTGWYKRQVRLWLFLIGLVIAFVGNVDSPFIIRYLWAHPQRSSRIADAATQQAETINAAKLKADEDKALELKKAIATDIAAKALPVRQSYTIDSLKRRLRVAQAQIQALSNHLHGLGFPIGRADSAGRDSARLPDVFFVRQPARTARQGRKLVAVPTYYLRYRRRPKTDEATTVPGITGNSVEWVRKALPVDSVSEKDLQASADRSEEKPWYEPIFGPQSASPWANFWGWVLTAAALSVGAPFWFDLLCRLVNIRNLGIKPPRPEQ